MGYEASFNAIRSRFQTVVANAQTPILPTGYDNDEKFVQPEKGPWARVTILIADSDLIELGQVKTHRHIGILFIQLFDDIGNGDKNLLTLFDVIDPLFRSQLFTGITYRTPTLKRVGQSEKWYQINVQIPFQFDITA